MWKAIAAVSLGSSLGALLRWWLGMRLNAYFPPIPPGTLAANLIGGYVVGLAVALFATYSALAPEWRLFVITGFCGGLTTFSTFSAEVVTLMQQGRASWALGAAAVALLCLVLGWSAIGLTGGAMAARSLWRSRTLSPSIPVRNDAHTPPGTATRLAPSVESVIGPVVTLVSRRPERASYSNTAAPPARPEEEAPARWPKET